MDVRAILTGADEARWRRRAGRLAPVGGALMVHLALLTLILSWKPPLTGPLLQVTEVSLVSGIGRFPAATIPPHPAAPDAPTPPPISTPSMETEAAPTSPTPPLKPALLPEPKNLPAVVAALTLGGVSLAAQPVQVSSPSSSSAAPASSEAAGGKTCRILESVQSTLQASEAARTALSLIPVRSRSVANAILLWDGHWIGGPAMGGSVVLDALEAAVVQSVGQAPATCQAELLHGPRFITLSEAQGTTVLAFGSGDWRWGDMLATVLPETPK